MWGSASIFYANTIYVCLSIEPMDGKTTPIRRIAVRETGVSRHHEGLIEGPPETPQTSEHYRIEGFKGALNWAPIKYVERCKYEFFHSAIGPLCRVNFGQHIPSII